MAKEVATARRLWAETGYGGVEDGVLDGAATKGPGLNSEHEAPAGCVISLIDNRAGEVIAAILVLRRRVTSNLPLLPLHLAGWLLCI